MSNKKRSTDLTAGIQFVEMEIPTFASEKEEAVWWDRHPGKISELLRRGREEGKITLGGVSAPAATKPITLRLEATDIERAKLAARRRGLRYQTYLRMIIHQSLRHEDHAS